MIGGDESIEHRDSYSCPALHLRPGKGQVDSGKVPLPIVFWIVGDRGQLEFGRSCQRENRVVDVRRFDERMSPGLAEELIDRHLFRLGKDDDPRFQKEP